MFFRVLSPIRGERETETHRERKKKRKREREREREKQREREGENIYQYIQGKVKIKEDSEDKRVKKYDSTVSGQLRLKYFCNENKSSA